MRIHTQIIIVLLVSFNAMAFTNQECFIEASKEIKRIRVLPINTMKAPCLVEIEHTIRNQKIKFIKFKSGMSIERCEKAAAEELLKTYSKGFQCGKE
jgi:hypothetical protein